jgi:hypothetical protein
VAAWSIAIAFLLAPLGCWALLARTKILGWTFAFVFAAYAVTEWFLGLGWRPAHPDRHPRGRRPRMMTAAEFPAEPGNWKRPA